MLLFQSATASSGKKLVGAQIAAGIEGGTQVPHRGKVTLRKHLVHEVDFLHPNAVLAGDGAATLQAFVQDLVAGHKHAFHLGRIPLIEQQNRMDVAIAGMEDIDDPQFISRGDFGDFAEDVRQLRAGDYAVLRFGIRFYFR